VVVFGPSLFLSWRTYQLADRVTSVESFGAPAPAECQAMDRALAATWSDSAARQLSHEQTTVCGTAERADAACVADVDSDDAGDTFAVFTGRVEDACGLRETALMTFRTTLLLTCLAATLAVVTLQREF
jgi:hypothetical protein